MPFQTVRALAPIRHSGVLRVPGQASGDNAQDFVVDDTVAAKLIAAGFVTSVGAGSAPEEVVPLGQIFAVKVDGVITGLRDEKGNALPMGSGGAVAVVDVLTSSSATSALSARRGKELNDGKVDKISSTNPRTVVLPSGVAWLNTGAAARTVNVTGGTVSAVYLATAAAPTTYTQQGSTSGNFTVQSGGQFKIDWSVQPTVSIS